MQIVRLEKTNKENANAINLNMLVEKIKNRITYNDILKKYIEKLANLNYFVNDYYDEKCFTIENIEEYLVNSEFPCIRRNSVSMAVNSVQYELKISMLKKG